MENSIRSYSDLAVEHFRAYGIFRRILAKYCWGLRTRFARGKKITICTASGRRFRIRIGDQISQILYLQGVYEPQLSSFLAPLLKQGMTVFDIGANIGYYSIMMAERVGSHGHVHCFEINKALVDVLTDNIALAGVNNVRIVEKAVAEKAGTASFHVPALGDEGEGSIRESRRYKAEGVVEVETITLDQYVQENGIENVDLIKIDIEGGELLAFNGAQKLLTSKTRPIIMFEALDTACVNFGSTWLDTVELIKNFGYRIYQADTANYIALPDNEENLTGK